MNNALKYIFIVKIVLTVLFWCIPSLFFSASFVVWLGFPIPEPVMYMRLLGMAYTSLVVGYSYGLILIHRGEYPEGTVWAGIVSNGGAAIILALYGFTGHWQGWSDVAQYSMWFALAFTAAIATGLLVCRRRAG